MHEAKELRTGFVETNGTKLYYEMVARAIYLRSHKGYYIRDTHAEYGKPQKFNRIVYDFLKSLK